jgi:hypothetical protein
MHAKRKQRETHVPWNKGKLMGQKTPLTPQEIWAITIRLLIPQQTARLAAPFATSICAARGNLGVGHRFGLDSLRHAFHA